MVSLAVCISISIILTKTTMPMPDEEVEQNEEKDHFLFSVIEKLQEGVMLVKPV